jgi:hypothetical protein
MKYVLVVFLSVLSVLLYSENGTGHQGSGVELTIVDNSGNEFPAIPFRETRDGSTLVKKDYLEARKGENYTITVRNNTPDRIGIVIAVDGRNIISGEKSYLRSTDRMYIVRPYGSTELDGWRTDRNTVNRFYFTDKTDSYSVRTFGDSSAMGVIAAAVFREKVPERKRYNDSLKQKEAAKAPSAGLRAFEENTAGTGFGDKKHSPSKQVSFNPEQPPFEKLLVKYEWRETLCRKSLIDCRQHNGNRLWDEDGYAPYPPGY